MFGMGCGYNLLSWFLFKPRNVSSALPPSEAGGEELRTRTSTGKREQRLVMELDWSKLEHTWLPSVSTEHWEEWEFCTSTLLWAFQGDQRSFLKILRAAKPDVFSTGNSVCHHHHVPPL